MSVIKLQVCNFQGKKDEMVPWVAVIEGEVSGLKKSQIGDKWVPACSPKTIIAILEAENRDEMLRICRDAIAQATPKVAKPVAPPPPTTDVKYFCFDGEAVMIDASGPVQLSALQATNIAVVNENALFCKAGTDEWQPAKALGLVKPAAVVPPPPPKPIAPPAPPAPTLPRVAEGTSEVNQPAEKIDAKTAAERILAKRNAS